MPQTHEFIELNKDTKLIIIIRDPREVVISHWRIYYAKYNENKLINRPTIHELDGNIDQVKQKLKTLYKYLSIDNHKILFRYENFFDNSDYVMNKIEKDFNINIPEEDRIKITSKTSLQSNQKIANKMLKKSKEDFFNTYDEETQIHARHINSPQPNSYKNILTQKQINYLNKKLEFELNIFGYAK